MNTYRTIRVVIIGDPAFTLSTTGCAGVEIVYEPIPYTTTSGADLGSGCSSTASEYFARGSMTLTPMPTAADLRLLSDLRRSVLPRHPAPLAYRPAPPMPAQPPRRAPRPTLRQPAGFRMRRRWRARFIPGGER